MSLDRIPGDAELYIGGLFTLRRHEALAQANITHVVSALRLPVERDLFKTFKHHLVEIDDVEDENIIQYFPASNAFIQEGLDGGGGVLVHCVMGKSRSTTLLIAYLLSSQAALSTSPLPTPSTLLSRIRQIRPFAEPNQGFMTQLALYHRLSAPSSLHQLEAAPGYQKWLFSRTVEERNSRGVAPDVEEIHYADSTRSSDAARPGPDDMISIAPIPEPRPEARSSPPISSANSSTPTALRRQEQEDGQQTPPAFLTYRCRRCRHQLATSAYTVSHSPLSPSPSSPNHPRQSQPQQHQQQQQPCAHLFLDPLSWMRPELEQGKVEGRLECPNPKCGTGVGRYAWQGMRCSCGRWVVPGVSLGRGKVDEVRVGGGGGRGVGGRGGEKM